MNKATLRKIYLEKRLTLTNKEYERRNKQLVENLFKQIDFSSTEEYIHIFLPIAKFKEVNTWPIINRLQQDYPTKKIVLPKVEGNELVHYRYESKEQLKTSKWGIEEPVFGTLVLPEQCNVVLVPLIIADKHGNRIGYGKGFYDRFLNRCKPTCKTIGLSLLPVLDEIDCVKSTDIALDCVIT